jgi:uroporphyrinogen-III synthase
MPRSILLLRSASLPEPDAYHSRLSACGYSPRSVPVLETVFVNAGLLEQQLSAPPDVCGVVLTSSRSAEAWRAALAAVYDHDPHAVTLETWRALPFYVVGAATSRVIEEADAARPELPVPSDVRGAAEAGTGEKLARFVLDDLAEDARGARLLYLTGDKNKETLPEILKDGGVILDTVQAYATQGAASFPEDLRRIVEEVSAVAGERASTSAGAS